MSIKYNNRNVGVTLGSGSANLGTKSITSNGVYNAVSDGFDGYSSVDVNVSGGDTPSSSASFVTVLSRLTDSHGQYEFNICSCLIPGLTYAYLRFSEPMSANCSVTDFTVSQNVASISYVKEYIVQITFVNPLTLNEEVSILPLSTAYSPSATSQYSEAIILKVKSPFEAYVNNVLGMTSISPASHSDSYSVQQDIPVLVRGAAVNSADLCNCCMAPYSNRIQVDSESNITVFGNWCPTNTATGNNRRDYYGICCSKADDSVDQIWWGCFQTTDCGKILKVRWEGDSPYNHQVSNRAVFEVFYFVQADNIAYDFMFLVHEIKQSNPSYFGTFTIQRTGTEKRGCYTFIRETPFEFTMYTQPYRPSMHRPNAEHGMLTTLNELLEYDGTDISMSGDSAAKYIGLPFGFMYNNRYYPQVYLHADCYIGVSAASTQIQILKCDASATTIKIAAGYCSDLGCDVLVIHYLGCAVYNSGLNDREWRIALCENGDIYILIDSVGARGGNNSVFGVSYTTKSLTHFIRNDDQGTSWSELI